MIIDGFVKRIVPPMILWPRIAGILMSFRFLRGVLLSWTMVPDFPESVIMVLQNPAGTRFIVCFFTAIYYFQAARYFLASILFLTSSSFCIVLFTACRLSGQVRSQHYRLGMQTAAPVAAGVHRTESWSYKPGGEYLHRCCLSWLFSVGSFRWYRLNSFSVKIKYRKNSGWKW